MKKQSRLLIYILVNIIVSALTTLAVLWLWEKAHPQPELTPISNTSNDVIKSQNHPMPSPTDLNPENSPDILTANIDVIIHLVVGAGNLDVEYVEIQNQSAGAIDLSGWQLVNQSNNTFIFPPRLLNSNGSIKIFSKKGENKVIELYWQAEEPIWQPGEEVRLLNADGENVATYSIP